MRFCISCVSPLRRLHDDGSLPDRCAAIQHVAAGGRTRIRTAINQSWQEQNIPLYCALSGRNPAPHEPRPTTCEFVANVLMFLRIHLAELKK